MATTALRAARPKLTLAVPGMANPAAGAHATVPKSPFPHAISPSPLSSPTARNTRLNQRGGLLYATSPVPARAHFQTLAPPPAAAPAPTSAPRVPAAAGGNGRKSSLKQPGKDAETAARAAARSIVFREEPSVRCVSPITPSYYGERRMLGREERRWMALI